MKKFQIILVTAISLAFASNANAQIFSASAPASEKALMANTSVAEANKFSAASVMVTKGGIRAVGNFNKNFKTGANVKWCAEENVITANFKEGGVRTTIVYLPNGKWLRNMKVYQEAQMPADIRELVKRSPYYDHNITTIQEFYENDILFYVVHLEDAKSWKQISIYNGDINLLSKIKKQ